MLAHALHAVGDVRLGVLHDLRHHRRHVQERRQQVVGERGVPDHAVLDLKLLQDGQADPLGGTPFELSLHALRVDGPPHLGHGGHLHHADQPQLLVDLDHGALRGEGELRVRIALAVLVEGRGGAVVMDGAFGDRFVQEVGDPPDRGPVGEDLAVLQGEPPARVLVPRSRADPLEQAFPDRGAGHLGGASGHERLPGRRRRPGRPHERVRVSNHHVLDSELGPGDLGHHRVQPLAVVDARAVQLGHRAAGSVRQGDHDLRRIVEALAVGDVLVPHGEPHSPADALAVGDVPGAAGQGDRVAVRARLGSFGQGDGLAPLDHLADGRGPPNDLPRREDGARLHRVLQPELDRVHTQGPGQPVHLGLVGEGDLGGPEPAHGPARRVVRVDARPLDEGVGDLVRPGREGGGVADHGRR